MMQYFTAMGHFGSLYSTSVAYVSCFALLYSGPMAFACRLHRGGLAFCNYSEVLATFANVFAEVHFEKSMPATVV